METTTQPEGETDSSKLLEAFEEISGTSVDQALELLKVDPETGTKVKQSLTSPAPASKELAAQEITRLESQIPQTSSPLEKAALSLRKSWLEVLQLFPSAH